MKKILLILLLLPNVAYSQGLSVYGGWGDAPERTRSYSAPSFSNYDFEWFPNLPDDSQYLPQRPYAEPTPDWNDTNPFLSVKPQANSRPLIQPVEPEVVFFPNSETTGTIIIDTKKKALYYTLDDQQAYLYPIGVGRDGFTWSGTETISRIQYWPDWNPPKEMLARRPDLPSHMNGGIKNPLGAVAMYLGNSMYRIHGTNDPKSIGKAESSGCFRMMNEHAVHLASIVTVGNVVKVYQ